jgi:hypothetical protein
VQANRASEAPWFTHPAAVALWGFLLVLVMTWPASSRHLSIDDVAHFREYPRLNEGVPLAKLLTIGHWQEYGGEELTWRPLVKVLWRALRVTEEPHTRHLWFVTGLFAALSAGALAMLLRTRGLPPESSLLALLVFAHPLTADVLLPFVGQSDTIAFGTLLGGAVCLCRGGVAANALGVVLIAISFFTKESGFPALAALPAALWLGPGRAKLRIRKAMIAAIIVASLIAARLVTHHMIFGDNTFMTGEGTLRMHEGERYPGFAETIGRYAMGIVTLQISGVDNCYIKAPGSSAGFYPIVGAAAFLGAIGVIAWAMRPIKATRANATTLRLKRLIAAGVLWTGLLLSIYLHLIPIGAIWQGRFMLLPFAGLAVALAAGLAMLRGEARQYAMMCVVIIGAFGAMKTFNHAKVWATPLTLWADQVARFPQSDFDKRCYALELYRAGKATQAFDPAKQAAAARPWDGDAWRTLGIIASKLGQHEEAVRAYTNAIPLVPYLPAMHAKCAEHLIALGRYDEARLHLDFVKGNTPDYKLLDQLYAALDAAEGASK